VLNLSDLVSKIRIVAILVTNVPSRLCAHAAVALPCTSLSLPRTFICLVYSQFKLIKIKIEKVNYSFLSAGIAQSV
jgi:hypothetical protein